MARPGWDGGAHVHSRWREEGEEEGHHGHGRVSLTVEHVMMELWRGGGGWWVVTVCREEEEDVKERKPSI